MRTPCHDAYPPIGDYAAIGDSSVVALVSSTGSIDWLCLPRFSSPSVFAAILDDQHGGRFRVSPAGEDFEVERRYVDDTVVLETTFRTPTGTLRLTDLMPVESEADKAAHLRPEREILRKIECLDGEVDVAVTYQPRPNYGTAPPPLDERGPLGLFADVGGRVLVLRSEIDVHPAGDGRRARGRERLTRGDVRFLSLSFTDQEPTALPTLADDAEARLQRSIDWWRDWAAQCQYQGDYRDEVVRSALTLKLLDYPPSGAVIAAPTTSLPEQPGGKFNWDYRYCWLRDASMVVRALLELGYTDESDAFLSWLLDATRLTWPRLQVIYDIFGESRLTEHIVDRLEGYRQARPVRVGNQAHTQLQLGVYGEVVESAFHHVNHGRALDWSERRMLVGLGKVVCDDWEKPDAGIWETRGDDSQHTHSKAMCWIALDRLVRLHEAGHLQADVQRFRRVRDEIAQAVETHGYNQDIDSYVGVFDDDHVDAALFLLMIYGYEGGPRRRREATCDRLRERLGQDGLVYRFRSGYDKCQGDVAPFGICSFWSVSALARQGRVDEAEQAFEKLLDYANDVGLYAEKIEPDTGAALGNFPQAFTHVGVINAAVTIAEERGHMTTRTQPPGPHERRPDPTEAPR